MEKTDYAMGFLTAIIIYLVFKGICYIVSPHPITTDYTKYIIADSSNKVEQCINNAIHDVSSRNFIVVNLKVEKGYDHKFIITCSGNEKGNLLAQ